MPNRPDLESSKEVLVPIWILTRKVEHDFEEYAFMRGIEGGDDEESTFPVYDSTSKAIEILQKVGIEFDTKTGQWKDS